MLRRFHAEHKRRYGYSSPEREVEIVTVRMRGRVASPEKLSRLKIREEQGTLKPAAAMVHFAGKRHRTQVIPRGFNQGGQTLSRAGDHYRIQRNHGRSAGPLLAQRPGRKLW